MVSSWLISKILFRPYYYKWHEEMLKFSFPPENQYHMQISILVFTLGQQKAKIYDSQHMYFLKSTGYTRNIWLMTKDNWEWTTCHLNGEWFVIQEHQPQQPNKVGMWPVLRMYSACCSVFAACWFLLASASARFSSALCLAAANLFISLSWALPLILSTSTWKHNLHINWLFKFDGSLSLLPLCL